MSGELTKEQLLEYVKKQKIKIKKLETELASVKETQSIPDTTSKESSEDALAELSSRIQELQTDLRGKNQEILLKSKKIGDLEARCVELEEDGHHLREEMNSLTEQLSALQTRVKNSSSIQYEYETLKAENTALKADLLKAAQRSDECSRLTESLRVSEEERIRENNRFEAKYKEILALQQSAAEKYAEEVASLHENLRIVKGENSDLEELQESVTRLTEEKQLVEQFLVRERESCLTLSNQLKQKEKELSEMQLQTESMEDLKTKLEALKTKLKAVLSSPAPEADQITQKLREEVEQLRLTCHQLEEAASADRKKQEEEVKQLREEVDRLENSNKIIKEAEDQVRAELNALNHRYQAESAEWKTCEENRDELKHHLTLKDEEIEKLRCTVDEKDALLKEKQVQSDEGAKEIVTLREQLDDQSSQLSLLKEEIAQNQEKVLAERKGLEDDVKSLQEELSRLTNEFGAKNDAKVREKAELELLNERQLSELELCKAEVKRLEDLTEKLQRELTETSNREEEEKRKTDEAQEELKHLLTLKEAEFEKQRRVLEQLEDELRSVQTLSSASLEESHHQSSALLRSKDEELEKLRAEVLNKEEYSKKLTIKVKQKMKETNELQEKYEQVAKEADALREEVRQAQMKVKEVNELLVSKEQQSTTLLSELNQLRDKSQQLEEQLTDRKTELMKKQEEYLALQQKATEQLNQLQQNMAERQEIQQKYQELQNNFQIISQEKLLYEQQSMQQHVTIQQLQDKLRLSESSSQEFSVFKEQLEKEKNDYLLKEKKYKAMLVKLNNTVQEKEGKLNQLEASFLRRPRRFQILLKININSAFLALLASTSSSISGGSGLNAITADAFSEWCYIFIDSPPSTDTPSVATDSADSASSTTGENSKYRWVEMSVIQDWLQQGSSLIGSQPSQQSIDQLFTLAYTDMKELLLQEKAEIQNTLQDLTQQFQTYKTRAQTALKRMNQEDRERAQRQEQENEEIDRLNHVIEDMTAREEALRQSLEQTQARSSSWEKELQERIEEVRSVQAQYDDIKRQFDDVFSQLQHQTKEMQQTSHLLQELREDHEVLQANYQHKVKELEEVMQVMSAPTSHAPATNIPVPLAIPIMEKESVDEGMEMKRDKVTSLHPPSPHKLSISTSPTPSTPSSSSHNHNNNNTHNNTNINNNSKLLVFQQADHLLKENLQILRDENSNLMLEVMELRNDMELRNEQIDALKATMRELESSLLREQEFNASHRRVNADYLVNILRKFLMTTDTSERSKLVSVLCSILHLQPEESRVIAEKWAVRPSGGLVSWLLPTAPSSSATHNIGKGKNASDPHTLAGGDLTYDPATGGGIDYSSY